MGLALWDGGRAVSEKGSDVNVELIGIACALAVVYETKKQKKEVGKI